MITISKETIDPSRASQLLAANTKNRPVKQQNLKFIVDQIKSGNWQFNGDMIRIDTDGNLLDGQHRLLAVVKTGMSIETLVVCGLDPNVFVTIDTGSTRSSADVLSVLGETNAKNLAAAVLLVNDINLNQVSEARHAKVSHHRLVELLSEHGEIRESIVWGRNLLKLAPPAVTTALHYLFSKKSKEAAQAFFQDIHDGIGLSATCPTLHLRNRLIQNQCSKSRMERKYMIALFIKAWNAYRSKRQVKTLRFREANGAEEFPTIL